VTPFLRWAGGKRWLAPRLAPIFSSRLRGTYYEPFLGSGALFFVLAPDKAFLSDVNEELINSYKVVAGCPELVLEHLRSIPVDSRRYYKIRKDDPPGELARAVRFIYLNRTCYGGLHRTNRAGKFNTPYGGGRRTPELLWRDGILPEASRLLRRPGVKLKVSDFEESIDTASEGDVVYCDPIYTTRAREQFDRYNSLLFGWDEQVRLKDAAYRAYARGALVVISDTYSAEIQSLYSTAFRIALERKKSIGRKAKDANRGFEYLIILDPADIRSEWLALGAIERRRARSRTATNELGTSLPGS
jgi:DNA adenine methylase